MTGRWKARKAKQASLSFHEPLGNLAQTARFPHSHSSGGEAGWESGKPKAGFPLSHRRYFICIGETTDKTGERFAPPKS